jgi:DNA-binding beta-propeller fold protein YncE
VDRRIAAAAVLTVLMAACTSQPAARRASPAPSPTASVPAAPQGPCAPAQAETRAPGAASNQPVLQLATGLTQPDDVLVDGDQLLIGELGPGQIARLGGDGPVGAVDVLPVHIPTVEGMARIGDTLYVADQVDDRIMAIRNGQASVFFPLQPVRGLDGVDSIAAAGSTLIVPDSPRGMVLVIGQDAVVQRRIGGFARPTGAWPLPDGSLLVADENGASVVKVAPDGSRTFLVRGLPLADDVVADPDGRVFAISINQGRLVEIANGAAVDVASNLQSPQGLGVDQAGNLYVSEYNIGRVDAVVMAFKLQPAVPGGPSLQRDQPLCVRMVRAPGFGDPISIDAGPGYRVVQQPGAGSEGSVLPQGCSGDCRVRVTVRSGAKSDVLWMAYRMPATAG